MQPVLRMSATRCKFYYIGPGRFFKGDFAQNQIVKRSLFRSFSGSCTSIYHLQTGIPAGFGTLRMGILAESDASRTGIPAEFGYLQTGISAILEFT